MSNRVAVLFVVVALLALTACAEKKEREGGAKKEGSIARAPRSIIQACRESIKAECSSAKERRNVFTCLEDLGDECHNWVQARKSCANAVKEVRRSLRACLRKADKEKEALPDSCKNTEYFRSLTSRGKKISPLGS